MKNLQYLLALHTIEGLGSVRLNALLNYFQDPQQAWQASKSELIKLGIPESVADACIQQRRKINPAEYVNSLQINKIKWLTIFDEKYPHLLKEITDPPIILYYQGEYDHWWDWRSVAVVGSRRMTGYGKVVTEKIVRELVFGSVTVVSGLATGIDTQAHKTTITEGGKTIAVLGGGLNSIYPSENNYLAKQIIEKGGALISEYPPDYASMPGNFPARNRIISGLCLAVIVVEAALDSGSLITAKLALEQGRDVYAVPGPITSEVSKGSLMLIKEGAKLLVDTEELLDELGVTIAQQPSTSGIDLSLEEKQVVDLLENEQKHIDVITRELGWTAAKTAATLVKLEIIGLIRNIGNGTYCRV